MAALLRERPIRPGSPISGVCDGADVADAHLGHREVEDREPMRAVQGDRGHDERQRDDHEQER